MSRDLQNQASVLAWPKTETPMRDHGHVHSKARSPHPWVAAEYHA